MKKRYRLFLILLVFADCALIYILSMSYLGEKKQIPSINTAQAAVMEEAGSLEGYEASGEAISDNYSGTRMVVPSGEPIGIYVKSSGVMVIGVGEITGQNGATYVPCAGLIKQGDYIMAADGVPVDDKNKLINIINASDGKEIELQIRSSSGENSNSDIEIYNVSVQPVKNKDGGYMLGLWVKDDISGIGTLTYYDEEGFGALGHSINDNDTGELFSVSDGAIYSTSLVNIVKSSNNTPGRLEGMIDYSSKNMVGRVEKNNTFGIKGYLTNNAKNSFNYENFMPVAERAQVTLGEAYLLSAINGKAQYYRIEITNIIYDNVDENKELQIEIKDSELISLTSGIVQGMSGTPIIQNGYLVGAVTHVLVNDPTKGYGIFIESMINE